MPYFLLFNIISLGKELKDMCCLKFIYNCLFLLTLCFISVLSVFKWWQTLFEILNDCLLVSYQSVFCRCSEYVSVVGASICYQHIWQQGLVWVCRRRYFLEESVIKKTNKGKKVRQPYSVTFAAHKNSIRWIHIENL